MRRAAPSLRLLLGSNCSGVQSYAPLLVRRSAIPSARSSLPHRGHATSPTRTSKPAPKSSTPTASASGLSSEPTPGPSPTEPMPRSARYLGLAGTIPFFSFAGAALFLPEVSGVAAASAQMYGASVLSFLGAVHWGVALRTAGGSARDWDFAYSVCPALAGAAAAVLPVQEGLAVLLPSFGAALVYDSVRFAGEPGVPQWYARLRKPLTGAAMAGTGICLGVVWEGGGLTVGDAAERTKEALASGGGK